MLGLPIEDLPFLLEFKDAILKPRGTVEEQRQAQVEWAARGDDDFAAAIKRARTSPGDDLLSRLIVAEVDGARLAPDELEDVCFQLVLGGLDTVAATLCLMWIYLARTPEHRRLVAADEAGTRLVVEELLRWETPVTVCKRVAKRDLDVAGVPISEGQAVMIDIMSANSDPNVMRGAEVVDIERRGNVHHTFGGGIHKCLGSHLARVELIAVMREWHRRIPDYQIDPDVPLRWSDANSLRMVEELMLTWPTR